MQQSKNLAITFLLGAVLVGGALGFTADRVMMRDRIARQPGRVQLADQLELDVTQRGRLDSILDDRNRHMGIVMAPVRPALDSIKERAREEIRSMLNPAQRVEFEKVLAEMNNNKNRDNDN
jgi:hypothetical protein